jgi:hypothetical protein
MKRGPRDAALNHVVDQQRGSPGLKLLNAGVVV